MPIAITSELRNQLKVLHRFDCGGNRRFISTTSRTHFMPSKRHALETLANNARCCVLNTRVDARSVAGTEIREEPIAYLLDNREANNETVGGRSAGVRLACLMDSNPAAAEADVGGLRES